MKRLLAIFLCLAVLAPSFGFATDATQQPTGIVEKETVLAALMDADIATMREALDLGLVTSEELTAYYLERIEAYNVRYNCFISMCPDALDIARDRDRQLATGQADGILFGIPVVIKDNMDLQGYYTTNGYEKKDMQIANETAYVVQSLLDQGAVIIGKTNMSTGALSARDSKSEAVGETMNAYNPYLAAGGSSGGTAVAVSLNFSVAGLGTDTNSSLRIPAALNGCVSLRPTFGLLSSVGIRKLDDTRDTPGAITRTVYDQAVMLDILTGGTHQYTQNLNANGLKGIRIGILNQLSYATFQEELRTQENMDDEVEAAFANAIRELESCGAEIVRVSVVDFFHLSEKTFEYGDAEHKEALYAAFQECLKDNNISAVIFPTYLSRPMHSGPDANGKLWNVQNQLWLNNCKYLSPCAGLPEITVPIGTHSLGAGIGMEIAAPRNCEQLLLDIAYAYTSSYDHRAIPTGAPSLYAGTDVMSLRQVIDDYKLALEQSQMQQETIVPAEPQSSVPAVVQKEQDEPSILQRYWHIGVLGLAVLTALCLLIVLMARYRAVKKREKINNP